MGWEIVEIDKIIEKPISGEWGIEPELNDSYVHVIRSTNFSHTGHINLNKGIAKRNIDDKKVEKKKLVYGDIIIEKSGGSPKQPVGRVIYFNLKDDTFLCSNFTSVLRAKKTVNSKYLHYLLFAHHQFKTTLSFQNKTTGIINLQLSRYLKKAKIPLPPLPIQKKIATILDAADNYRQKTKALIDKYDQLTQSIFLDMFGDPVRNEKGWDTISLSDYGDFKNGLNYGSNERGNKVKYIGVGDFKSFYKLDDIEKLKTIDLSVLPNSAYFLNEGDLLFVRSNGNRRLVGRCLAVYPNGLRVTYSGFCIRYRIKDKNLEPLFLTFLFRNKIFKQYMLSSGRGANIQNINQSILNRLKVINPPIEEQSKFRQHILKIQSEIEKTKQLNEKSEQLFQSLLQKAFKGELVN